MFKTRANRAGTTLFVAPELVHGTLREAHGLLGTLPDGLPKAAYLMFVISEVHPYSDGNGRVARALMNAALERCRRAGGHALVWWVRSANRDAVAFYERLGASADSGPLSMHIPVA